MMILYADDDVDDREILFDVVNQIDPAIRCEFANNGLEAMNFLAESHQRPDYIFLDINMPLMNGKTCLTILKSHSTLKTIPVIMYSTTILQEEVRELYSLGAMSVIQKPNDIAQLYSTMSELFTQISCVR
jgi:CheY-like chemotaxis protein